MDSGQARVLQRSRGARVVIMAMLLIWVPLSGCVETADCNESVRCPDGQVCYRYECRRRCDEASDCGDGTSCRPCVDPETEENYCFGERARACLADE